MGPLDLQSGGVEVVKITPKSQSQALYEKNKQTNNKQTKSILVNKQQNKQTEQDQSKNQDSGHETSSIHTENSDQGSNPEISGSSSASSDTSSSSHQLQVNGASNSSAASGDHMIFSHHAIPPISKNKLYSVGRAKPVPPPRSHSLEQHNYADQKKQPSNPTVIRAVEAATTGNDAATAAAASS